MRTNKVCGIFQRGLVGSALLVVVGCQSASRPEELVESRTSAVVLSATNLDLQVSGNSCWANGSQEQRRCRRHAERRHGQVLDQ